MPASPTKQGSVPASHAKNEYLLVTAAKKVFEYVMPAFIKEKIFKTAENEHADMDEHKN